MADVLFAGAPDAEDLDFAVRALDARSAGVRGGGVREPEVRDPEARDPEVREPEARERVDGDRFGSPSFPERGTAGTFQNR
ncbi:MAG: hypothetical protein WB770_02020 [Acidimicrobiales bacterium]